MELDKKPPSLQMELERGRLPPTQDIFWERSFFLGNFTNLVSYGFGKSTIFLGTDKLLLLTQCKNLPCLHSVRVQSYTV